MHAFMIENTAAQEALTSPEALKSYLSEDMVIVNNIIREKIHSAVALIPHLSSYIIRSGGKRLRPLMAIAAGRLFQDAPSMGLYKLAASIEFIHTASLLHDDVVDDSDMRRNQPSANSVWGNAASVLVGDFLLAKGFSLLSDLKNHDVTTIMSQAAGTISEGEVLQLTEAHNLEMSQETYLSIIEAKTAQLFAAGIKGGALLSNAPEHQAEALYEFGINVGILFQLVDDNLDYLVESSALGKRQGSDFREGKVTLPVILAYMKGDHQEQAFWKRTIADIHQEPEDFGKALHYINQHHVFDQIYALCYRYVERAQKALHVLPDHPLREYLAKIIEYCLHRRY